MSLKRDKGFSRWSITGRLIFLYTVSASIILLISAFFLYWVLESNLEREGHQFLADQIYILRVILEERPNDRAALEEEVNWEGTVRQFTKYYVRILDGEGHVLIETSQMSDILKPSIFSVPRKSDQEPTKGSKWKSKSGKSYRLMSAWANLGATGSGRGQIQAALNITHEDEVLAEYRNKLGIVIFLGILLSAGASFIVARRGMKPLSDITKQAKRITATHLHERIDPRQWPEELRALAIAFDEMLGRLEESFSRLSQFSADLAHELRTPVNNLMGETEVVLSKPRTSDEYREILESSLEEYHQLARIIDNLLFLARAENAEGEIKKTQFNILKEVEVVREFYEAVTEEQGIKVTSQGDVILSADPILFRRAVSNLLSNAIHYTPSGGTITIAAKQPDPQFVEVSVSDTGSGIDPEHLPKIFDRFYRIDQARSKYPQGTGLGLSIVKSIMKLHGGKVSIQSQPSQGTTVTLHFPPR